MDTNFIQQPEADVINAYLHSPAGNPFKSFWMAGYECSDKLNAFGERVDLLTTTGHLRFIEEDYQNLSVFGMGTVREGIRWSEIEKRPYVYDWSVVERMIDAGRKKNIQQVWDLCHFGFPDDLTPLHPHFARRFAAMCRAFTLFYREQDPTGDLVIIPINEVSFLSWLGGDVRGTAPYCIGQGWEVKYALMRAYIEGIQAIKEVDASVRILTSEPLVNIVTVTGAAWHEVEAARNAHEEQFQVTDILCGRMCPELGGRPEYLDIIGYNYYYNNQWVLQTHESLDWKNTDERFVPLHQLLLQAEQRYSSPVVLTETSHPREDRPFWIKMIGDECALALEHGLQLWGICWYPIINRCDWDNLSIWHESGLWDGQCSETATGRVLNVPAAAFLFNVQDKLARYLPAPLH